MAEKNSQSTGLIRFFTGGKFSNMRDISAMDEIVRYILLNVAFFAGVLLLIGFGISVLLEGNVVRSLLDFSVAVLGILGLITLRSNTAYMVSASIPVSAFGLLCVVLTFSGAAQGFAGLWIYAFPLMSIFLLGLWPGIFVSLLLLSLVAAVVFIPGYSGFDYTPAVAFRLCGVYFLVLTLTIVYEGVRQAKENWIKRLSNDLQAERDEMAAMKDNLRVGLFLMDRNYIIQPQYSKAMEEVLSETELQGKNFVDLLSASIKSKEQETLKDYFTMVFDRAFDVRMLEDINPLHEFNYISIGTMEEKTLRCSFASVDHGKDTVFILGTIQDVTNEVNLQRQLSEEENKRQEEMRSIFEIIQVEPRVFGDFIEDTEYEFNRINDTLKDKALSSQEAMVEIYQSIHAIKSNAVILGLEQFSEKLHALESKIKKIREQDTIGYEEILHITLELEKIMREKDRFSKTVEKIQSFKTGDTRNQDEYVLVQSLIKASEKAARDLGKKVRFVVEGLDSQAIENGPRRLMKEVLTQLVRNAVAHGIESPEERLAGGKDELGLIRLSIKIKDEKIHIRLADDGKGLDFSQIREQARKNNLIQTDEEAQDKNRLVRVLFAPGFSTAETEGVHAGRGIGLNLVRERLQSINGSIKLQTEAGKGTTFNVFIPLSMPAEINQAS
jgi:two-component system chemotaxis sensor kinase CheA